MKHTLYYSKFGVFYRPLVRVTLRYRRSEVDYLALLDSGADFNIFHSDIAKILKINLKNVKQKTTFGGIQRSDVKATAYPVSMEIGINNDFVKTLVSFSDEISLDGYGVLGQQGFFSHFSVQFEYATKKITIEG